MFCMYSIKDSFSGFGPVFMFESSEEGLRAFIIYLNDRPIYLAQHSYLYLVGMFDKDDGIVTHHEPILLACGDDYVDELKKMIEDNSYFPDVAQIVYEKEIFCEDGL